MTTLKDAKMSSLKDKIEEQAKIEAEKLELKTADEVEETEEAVKVGINKKPRKKRKNG